VKLWLKGYLTPSPNKSRWAHWRVAQDEKRKARRALLSALQDALRICSTETTSGAASNRFLIVSAIQGLSLAMMKRRFNSKSARRKLST